MVKNPVNMSSVFDRRMRMLDTRPCNAFIRTHYESAMDNIKNGADPKTVRNEVLSFIKECSSKEGSKQFKQCMYLLDEMGNDTKYDKILDECFSRFLSDVVSYMEKPIHAFSFSMGCFNLHPKANAIKEAADQYHICDRIIDNHTKLSKRFKLNEISQIKSMDKLTRMVCEMIDTYDIKPHVKMELVFEEALYLADSYGIKVNQPAMVESVTDYFLSLPSNTEEDIHKKYPKTIKESMVLNKNADYNVAYLTGRDTRSPLLRQLSEASTNTSVKDLINQYKTETEKTDGKFKQFMNKLFTQSPQAIIDDTPDLLKWVRNFGILGVLSKNTIAGTVTLLVNGYIHYDLRKKETSRVIKYFEKEQESIEDEMFDAIDDEKREKLEQYSKELEKAIDKLKEYNDSLYTDNERFNQDDSDVELETFVDMNEAKIQLNKMIDDAVDADKFIEKVSKPYIEKLGASKTEDKDTLTTESIMNYIDEDSRISLVLCSYDISECEDKSALYEAVDAAIGACNNYLQNRSAKVYYTILGESIDFEMKSKFKVLTNLSEDAAIRSELTDVEKLRIGRLYEATQYMEQLESLKPQSLVNKAMRKVGSLTTEQCNMFLEAWSYGAPIDREDMDRFVDYCKKYQMESGDYIDAYELTHLYDNLVHDENACAECVVESAKIMQDILSEAVDLNSLKLSWMAFKKKMKDFSAKEKEACRDLDMTFNNFTKAVKNFYGGGDRREQIIKGQVNPSLSKIIKIGISLAAVGVAAQSIAVPAILLVGGLAMNKHTSDKEKKMILDEIDIELQVVDREIRRCENDNKSSRKYRTLLTYQKNLQREKQRIVYGLSRKGIPVTKSTAGLPEGGE